MPITPPTDPAILEESDEKEIPNIITNILNNNNFKVSKAVQILQSNHAVVFKFIISQMETDREGLAKLLATLTHHIKIHGIYKIDNVLFAFSNGYFSVEVTLVN